jgi:hypothetical protein
MDYLMASRFLSNLGGLQTLRMELMADTKEGQKLIFLSVESEMVEK